MFTPKKRLVVTGAAGNLGLEFVKQYKDVYQIVGSDLKQSNGYPEGVSFVRADISQPGDCYALFEQGIQLMGGIDGFVHCGAVSAPGKDQILTFEVNARGTFYLLQACVLNKISHVVLVTSGWVQGLPSPEITPRRLPINENTVGLYKDVYHISKKFNEDNGKMHVENGQIPLLISLRYGGIINVAKDGLKALSTEPYWTRLPLEDAAVALAKAVEFDLKGFHYFLIGSKFRYNDQGQLEEKEDLRKKLIKHGYEDMFDILENHFPGKQTYDLSKSLQVLKFNPRW